MKFIFYTFVIFYVIYVVNKFLGKFYFQKFTHNQQDIMNEMMRKQQQKKEGEIRIENLKNQKAKEPSSKTKDGDYIDYEVIK